MKIIDSKWGQFIVFQLQWWLCILNVQPYLKYGYIGSLVLLLFILFLRKTEYKNLLLIVLVAVIGIINDSLLTHFGIYVFPSSSNIFLIPNWLITLWFCFGAWFVAAAWINKNYFLFCAVSMITGPLSYLSGTKLSALVFTQPERLTLTLIGINWILLGFVFVTLQKYFHSKINH